MRFLSLNRRLGLVVLIVSAWLVIVAIPRWVSSPSNVSNVVLSPAFWPYILAALLAIVGVGLLLTPQQLGATVEKSKDGGAAAWLRLVAMALIMFVTMVGLTTIGMVWTSMLTFLFTALMFRTRYPITAIVCAVLIPLVLYTFFAHVAGVAIPQGNYVRLP